MERPCQWPEPAPLIPLPLLSPTRVRELFKMKIKPHYAPIEILLAEPPPHHTLQARLLGSRAFHITAPVSAHLLPPLCSLPCFQHLPASCCSSNIPKPCPASGPLHGLQSRMEHSAPECLPGYSTYMHSGLNSSITSSE